MRIGHLVGRRYDLERLRNLLVESDILPSADPMEQLAKVTEPLGLQVTPIRMPLAEAVWHANQDTPIVFWCRPQQRFLIVSYASAFRLTLALYEQGVTQSKTIARAELALQLGLNNVNEVVEVGVIHPASPAEEASATAEQRSEELATRYGVWSHRLAETKRKHGGHGDHGHHGHHSHHAMPPFTRLLKILKPERRDILSLLIFAVLSGVLYLALPFAVDSIVTNLAFGAQTKPYFQALLAIAQVLTVCLLLQALVIGFQYYVAELIQRRIFVRAAGDLAFRLPRVKAETMDGVHGPELVNRFLDVVTVQKNTAFFLVEGINLVAASVIGMVLLALYHPLLLAFVILLVIIITATIWLFGRKAVDTAIDESRSKYELVAWFEEIAAYPAMFKGPGGYDLAQGRTNMLASQYILARTRHFGIVLRQVSGLLAVSVLSSVALLLLGTWLVLSQQITLGQLVASELIMSGIVASLIKLGKKLESWYDTMAATDKLGHLFDLETETEFGETLSRSDAQLGMQVECRHMSFGFDPHHALLSEQQFTLAPGERVAIHGPQGSGVSTLLDLLFVLRQPSGGQLLFNGIDSRSFRPSELRESIQLLRRNEFIDGTIIENLRLGRPNITLEEIRHALASVGLLDACSSHPDGLNRRISVGGAPLSTSQRICLLVARAIVQRPRLLLIDELLDGLDPVTFARLTDLILDRQRPWTVVIASRMPEMLSLCDRTLELTPNHSHSSHTDAPAHH